MWCSASRSWQQPRNRISIHDASVFSQPAASWRKLENLCENWGSNDHPNRAMSQRQRPDRAPRARRLRLAPEVFMVPDRHGRPRADSGVRARHAWPVCGLRRALTGRRSEPEVIEFVTLKWAAREAGVRFHTVTNGIPHPLQVRCGDRIEEFRDPSSRKLPAERLELPELNMMTADEATFTIRRIVDRVCWDNGYLGWFLAQGWHGMPPSRIR